MARSVWLLAPALGLVLLPSNVVATALPLLRSEWAASATELGVVVAAYQVGYVGAVLVLLPLTDRVPVGRVMTMSAAAAAVGYVAFGFVARDVWSASALRVLAGAGLAGVYLPGTRVVAAAVSRGQRGLAISVYVSAFYLGSAASLWATGALLAFTDWRGAAVVLGGLSILGPVLAALGCRHAPAPRGTSSVLRPRVLAHGRLLRVVLAYAGHSWELYVSRGWLAAFLAAVLAGTGLGPTESAADGGKWAALIAGLGTVGVWLGGWVSDRWGRAPSALTIAAASGCMSLVFGWLGGLGWVLLVVIGMLYGLLLAADSAIYSTAVIEVAPPDELGSAQAAQAFIGFLASAISPVAAGLVLDLGGGFGGAFMLAGLPGLLGALALAPLVRRGAAPASAVAPATSGAPRSETASE